MSTSFFLVSDKFSTICKALSDSRLLIILTILSAEIFSRISFCSSSVSSTITLGLMLKFSKAISSNRCFSGKLVTTSATSDACNLDSKSLTAIRSLSSILLIKSSRKFLPILNSTFFDLISLLFSMIIKVFFIV